jgi:AbrB family looped-hinge helix DNA binding protein
MQKGTLRINQNGRVVIPAAVRAALGVRPGDSVVYRLAGRELRITSVQAALERARKMVRKYIPADVSLSDELIRERRREADRENRGS